MAFDPDRFLATPPPAAPASTAPAPAGAPAAPAPSGFDPDAYLASNPTPKQAPGALEALGRGALQGATLGFSDELGGAIQSLFGNKSYTEARDEIRANNDAAKAAHPNFYLGGELGGGLATAVVPGLGALKGAGAVKTGLQAAAIGGASAAGNSDANTAGGVLRDAAEGAAIGGVGGTLLHAAGSKIGDLLSKAPEYADQQAIKGIIQGEGKAGSAALSKAKGVILDENTPKVLNEPVQHGGKITTLADVATKPAEEVRPVLQSQKAAYEAKIDPIYKSADAASGGVKIGDLINHYDQRIAEYGANPMNEPFVKELEGARGSVLKSWGPNAEEVTAKQGEIGQGLDKIYDKADKTSGGVRVGDLVKHYDDQIAELSKTPGNQAFVKSLEEARDDVIKSWATPEKFNPDSLVKGGTFDGMKTGDAIARLEKFKTAAPGQASQLDSEIDRIRQDATRAGFDPETRIPAKQVRAFATTLQDRGAQSVDNPSVGLQARKLLGSTTRDFVNDHVENVLGPKDRKALEGLNERMSNLYKTDDVLSGKEADPDLRNKILGEFDKKVPAKEIAKFSDALADRGSDQIDRLNPGLTTQAKRELGNTTRDFLNKHIENTVSGEDLAKVKDLNGRLTSLRKIDNALADRQIKEATGNVTQKSSLEKLVGHGGALAAVPMIMHGNIPGAAAMLAIPKALEKAPAVGRAITRGAVRANGLLARVIQAADAGNPWAMRQLAALRAAPGGLSRLAQSNIMGSAGGTPAVEP